MSYPCGIIRDLLPLYIDGLCNDESQQAVAEHLQECEKCRVYYESMQATDGFAKVEQNNAEDIRMANSLKKVKLNMNKKTRKIIITALAIVVVGLGGYHLLFNTAIKEVKPGQVFVTANVYSLADLTKDIENTAPDSDNYAVTISSDENDDSSLVTIAIPELGEVGLSESTLDTNQYATVVSFKSKYFLRSIRQETVDNTIYITAYKTSILGNDAKEYQKTMMNLVFQKIEKIIFVDEQGNEKVLWQE